TLWKDPLQRPTTQQPHRDTGRVPPAHSPENAARERSRVRNLRQAFHSLQAALPSVPPDTKLSKLDVLVLATNYIAYLTKTLDQDGAVAEHTAPSRPGGYLHPVKVRNQQLKAKQRCSRAEVITLSEQNGLCSTSNSPVFKASSINLLHVGRRGEQGVLWFPECVLVTNLELLK
uniref:BHLH domain-containing protein n=1 Tax=Xiphophorus couchianus TaxID=32473 RepID=A0A3B5KT65_9TELE